MLLVLALRSSRIVILDLDLWVLLLLAELLLLALHSLLLLLLLLLMLLLLVLLLHLIRGKLQALWWLGLLLLLLLAWQGETSALEASRGLWTKLLFDKLLRTRSTATLTAVDLGIAVHWGKSMILLLRWLLLLLHSRFGLDARSTVRRCRHAVFVTRVWDVGHAIRVVGRHADIVVHLLLLLLLLLRVLLLDWLLLLWRLLWCRRSRFGIPRHLRDSAL